MIRRGCGFGGLEDFCHGSDRSGNIAGIRQRDRQKTFLRHAAGVPDACAGFLAVADLVRAGLDRRKVTAHENGFQRRDFGVRVNADSAVDDRAVAADVLGGDAGGNGLRGLASGEDHGQDGQDGQDGQCVFHGVIPFVFMVISPV